MLTILVLHIFISLACLFCGFLVHDKLLRSFKRPVENTYRAVIIYLVTGLISLTAVCQWIILLHPLTPPVKLLLLSLLLAWILIYRKDCSKLLTHITTKLCAQPLVTLCIIATWLVIVLLNSGPPMMDDTESYHIQMVKWIEAFGSVPGMANLHERYGFNSSWFSTLALFRPPVDSYNFYMVCNGTISLWFAGYLLHKAGQGLLASSSTNRRLSIPFVLIFVISMFAWPMTRGNASTANYDFITTLSIFVLFSECITVQAHAQKWKVPVEWVLWPVYLFTVRIINYPFLLLPLVALYTYVKQKRVANITTTIFLSLMLLIPFLGRNLILSGYAFYPSMSFDWFAVDWKPEKEKIFELLRYIKYFNRVNTGFQSIEVTEKLAFPAWIISWFRHLFYYDKWILVPALAGFLSSALFIKRFPKPIKAYVVILFIAQFMQLISWFLIAPDPRFIYGTLLCGIFTLAAILVDALPPVKWNVLLKPFFMVTITVVTALAVLKWIQAPQYRNWLVPLALPQPPVNTIMINNHSYYLPEKMNNNWNRRCYATELPCIYDINPKLERRGNSLSDGFRIKN
jgi:hypothetical protein